MPLPAWAQVCAEAAPGWDGVPVTVLGEAATQMTSPLAILLLCATALALRLRNSTFALICVLGWTGLVSLVVFVDPTGTQAAAIAEGCRARPTLFILAVAAICIATVLYTNRRTTRL